MAKTVEQLKAEKAAIERRIRQKASKEATVKRKALTRKKIVVGGTIMELLAAGKLRLCAPTGDGGRLELVGRGGDDDLATLLKVVLRRPSDRAAVGLPPLP